MIRWYVMPAEVVTVNNKVIRRPQFIYALDPPPRWGWMPVKDEWGVGWVDLTVGQHNAYNTSAGVLFLTDDLDAALTSGQVTGLVARLDARNLPSSWVNTSVIWRSAIKRVLAYIMQMQRFYGEARQSLTVGRSKTTAISTLAPNVLDRLDAVGTTLSLRSRQGTDTIESMMQRWADDLVSRPIFIGGIEF